MTAPQPKLTDARLKAALVRRSAGQHTSAELLGDVLAAIETVPQGRRWSLQLAPQRSVLPILVAAALLLAALIGLALAAGSRDTPLRQGTGLITYESGGDIYVGDPATGETTAVVTGPEVDSRPIFSPDGERIAFVRGDPETAGASVLVVRPDGSDERIVMPTGFSARGLGFSWTPDSASLVVNHDSPPHTDPHFDGELTLFDAIGAAPPRLLTPPLPHSIGAWHPQVHGEVAPMFRPPSGDRILDFTEAAATSSLVEMDVDGSNIKELIDPARTDLPFQIINGAIWSPDGRWIAVLAHERCPRAELQPFGCMETWSPNPRIYVVSADGQELRRLTRAPDDVDPGRHATESATAWSPDGSRILIDRTTAEYLDVAALATDTFPLTGQTLVVDVASGAEQAVTGLTTGKWGPPYGPPPAGSESNGITWVPSSTSSWSPDGRSILVFEGPGTRPLVIDLETGAATRLPWTSDSHPSWRLSD